MIGLSNCSTESSTNEKISLCPLNDLSKFEYQRPFKKAMVKANHALYCGQPIF